MAFTQHPPPSSCRSVGFRVKVWANGMAQYARLRTARVGAQGRFSLGPEEDACIFKGHEVPLSILDLARENRVDSISVEAVSLA